MTTICIDARLWGIKDTGPGRYTQNLIDNLPSDPQIRIVLIISPDHPNMPSDYTTFVARYHPYSLLSQLEMLFLLARIRPDLLHSPHFTVPFFWPGKMVVTIHDLIKHYSRGARTTTRQPWLYWFKYLGYLATVWWAVHRAVHIITPSQYWRDKLIRLYHLPPAKISVTYEAVSTIFKQDPLPPSFPLPKHPYVIHTGNLYPHKNIPVLIAAVNALHGQVDLVLVSARTVFLDRLPSSPFVKFLGRVSDSDLINLYRQAVCYVFPSLIEGFGLPGLEAMAAGTPVIASDSSCLPEIYGPAALYFNPRDPADLAKKILSLKNNSRLRSELISKGKARVNKYSWSKMAAQTWKIYLDALR